MLISGHPVAFSSFEFFQLESPRATPSRDRSQSPRRSTKARERISSTGSAMSDSEATGPPDAAETITVPQLGDEQPQDQQATAASAPAMPKADAKKGNIKKKEKKPRPMCVWQNKST